MDACIFCASPSAISQFAVLYADETVRLLLHDDDATAGHAMLVTAEHVENLSDLTEPDLQHFTSVWKRAEAALLEATGAERAIVMKLGIQVPHLHLHIYPVSSALGRSEVFAIINGEVRASLTPAGRQSLIDHVRTALL